MRLCGSFWRAAGGGGRNGAGARRGIAVAETERRRVYVIRDVRNNVMRCRFDAPQWRTKLQSRTGCRYGVRRTFRDSSISRAATHRPLADTSDARYAPYASTVHTHMTGIHLLPQRPIHTHTIQPHTHSSRFQHGDSGQLSRPSLTTSHDGGSQVLSSTMVRGGFGCAMHAAAHDVRACVP